MPLSQSEVLALVDEINVAVSELILNFAQLTEGMVDDAATDAARDKILRLKQQTDVAKERLQQLRDAQQRRRELEKIRKDHERENAKATQTEGKSSGMVYLRDGRGRVIGSMRVLGKGRTDYFATSGRLVAREVGGKTYFAGGAFAGAGEQGLRVLGQRMAA